MTTKKEQDWDSALFLSYVQTLIELVSKLYKKQFHIERNNFNRLVKEFYELVESYYTIPNKELPRVATFAKMLNISPNYLGDIIKHFTDKTASEIIHEHILNRSKKMLLETKMSVSEIAHYLGYDYPTYFSRFFKKKVGMSPNKYRNQ